MSVSHTSAVRGWNYNFLSATDATTALLMGHGSAATPATTAAASKNFVQFYTQSTDATGADSRGVYWRHYLGGAGGSGESVRAFTTVNAAGANAAHGVHASVSFGTNGTLTGEAAGVRATLQVPNKAISGTATAVYAELSADGASSAVQAQHGSFFRAVLAGEATGLAALEDSVGLFSLEGGTVAGGNMFAAKSGAAVSHVIRIFMNGTPYYLMVSDQI